MCLTWWLSSVLRMRSGNFFLPLPMDPFAMLSSSRVWSCWLPDNQCRTRCYRHKILSCLLQYLQVLNRRRSHITPPHRQSKPCAIQTFQDTFTSEIYPGIYPSWDMCSSLAKLKIWLKQILRQQYMWTWWKPYVYPKSFRRHKKSIGHKSHW